MFPIKYLSLQKSELEYEVRIRGATAASSVEELRKQILKLAPELPSEHILESSIDVREDLKGCFDVLTKIKLNLDATDPSSPNVPSLMRTQNMLNHLNNRIVRIARSDDIKKEYDEVVKAFKQYSQKLATLQTKAPCASFSAGGDSASESRSTAPELQNIISVTCDRGSADLSKLKFNGKTCVRSFIQRVNEFIEARNTPAHKIISFATEIFQDDALHWYRSVKDSVSSWTELADRLREDFDQTDYDYRLKAEIRSRTQGERENITIYLSIMNGMFSRLSKPVPEDEQLEIILHNIRPCYASTLASASQIASVDALRTLCRNYEAIQARLAQFQEPPRVTSDTLAPEFAYSKDSNRNTNKLHNSSSSTFNKHPNFTPNRNFNKSNNSNNYNQNNFSRQQQSYVHAVGTNKNVPYCPRCRSNAHHIRQCPASRDIFCFKCGMKDVKFPDCPVCNKMPKN